MKNIVLTGFMASGKTEIGKQLARMTGFQFVDTDALVEAQAGCSVNEIFARWGENKFRDMETEAVKKAAAMCDAVIATGGGAVLRQENIEILRRTGVIVNLDIPDAVLLGRMKKASDTRPLMREDAAIVLKRLHDRKPYYDCCDEQVIVSDEKKPDEHAEEILKRLDFVSKIQ